MEISNKDAMAAFAADVRSQEEPFNAAAAQAWGELFRDEYRRLRAAQLESGNPVVQLNVVATINFEARSVEMVTTPSAVRPKSRRAMVSLPPR